jgi:hypothetical protein
MEAAKSFSVRLANALSGPGTQFELGILREAVKAGQYMEVVRNHFFVATAQ